MMALSRLRSESQYRCAVVYSVEVELHARAFDLINFHLIILGRSFNSFDTFSDTARSIFFHFFHPNCVGIVLTLLNERFRLR